MIELEDVKRLKLEPGDTLIIRVPKTMNADRIAALFGQVHDLLPGHTIMVLDQSVDLEVLSGS